MCRSCSILLIKLNFVNYLNKSYFRGLLMKKNEFKIETKLVVKFEYKPICLIEAENQLPSVYAGNEEKFPPKMREHIENFLYN